VALLLCISYKIYNIRINFLKIIILIIIPVNYNSVFQLEDFLDYFDFYFFIHTHRSILLQLRPLAKHVNRLEILYGIVIIAF